MRFRDGQLTPDEVLGRIAETHPTLAQRAMGLAVEMLEGFEMAAEAPEQR